VEKKNLKDHTTVPWGRTATGWLFSQEDMAAKKNEKGAAKNTGQRKKEIMLEKGGTSAAAGIGRRAQDATPGPQVHQVKKR